MEVTTAEIAARGVILRGTVGSTAHALDLAGTDDRDEMGIGVEPSERVIGLTSSAWVAIPSCSVNADPITQSRRCQQLCLHAVARFALKGEEP